MRTILQIKENHLDNMQLQNILLSLLLAYTKTNISDLTIVNGSLQKGENHERRK